MQNNMIPLTVANTLDQTTKQRIEAKPNQTLKQAVQAQKLAPQGAFDVYDQLGKVISGSNVANHRTPPSTWAWPRWRGRRSKTPYTRIAGGFSFVKPVKQHKPKRNRDVHSDSLLKEKQQVDLGDGDLLSNASGNMNGYVLNHAEILRNPRKAQPSLTAIPGKAARKKIRHGGIMV